ncbi:MAG TPA: hypothetical protein VKS79_26035 [Gemmataceae bacterium]|nr:hypothetical protein [Gemmataceae bacterium]
MKRSPIALIVCLVLFVGWMSWLGKVALQHRNPVVVSRSQLLEAQCSVLANLSPGANNKPDQKIQVQSVISGDEVAPAAGQTITVRNMADTQGFIGNGTYVLPLVKSGADYLVAGLPVDPGFPPSRDLPPRIYPWTPEVKKQFESIRQGH